MSDREARYTETGKRFSTRLRKLNRQGNMLTVRLERDEYDAILEAADISGKSLNQFCRGVLLTWCGSVLADKARQL